MNVFLSYSAADRKLADRLRDELSRDGLSVWDDSRGSTGTNRRRQLEEAIGAADDFLILVGARSRKARHRTGKGRFHQLPLRPRIRTQSWLATRPDAEQTLTPKEVLSGAPEISRRKSAPAAGVGRQHPLGRSRARGDRPLPQDAVGLALPT